MNDLKRKYARFLVEGCLKLGKGDKLFIIGYNLIEDFMQLVKEEALKLGVIDVKMLINDPFKQKELYLKGNYEEIISNPIMDRTMYNTMAREGYAFLSLSSTLPGFYEDVDAELLSKVSHYQLKSISEYKEYQLKGLIKWNISAVPNSIWAKDLFGTEDDTKLWNLIFDICLIREDDPILAWKEKLMRLKQRANYLNNLKMDKLIYHNSLGTNLEIGLPVGYVFQSASEGTGNGNIVNMPTEEVFTAPHKDRVDGIVYGTKPYVYNGTVIENFWVRFEKGKVVEHHAEKNEEVLGKLLNTDEGARHIGEIALVPASSPINKSGLLFFNTLFDENAACHIAFGAGYPGTVKGGESLSEAELQALGVNKSLVHEDVMIGAEDMTIIATSKSGKETLIFEKGEWAF